MTTESKHVMIAGGTSGIGLATAKKLIEKGIRITITGRDNEKLQHVLTELGPLASGEVVDSSDIAQLQAFMKKIDPITDLVITVSGGKGMGLFRDLDLQQLKEGFEEKLFPQLATAQAAIPYIASHGSITFVSAASSQAKREGTGGLAAINGSLEIMVPVLAKELKPIRVNAVSPGVINTPWWNFLPEETKLQTFQQLAQSTPVERVGQPEDIAAVIDTLLGNTFITGQVITVDGGYSL
ncbi:SDR family oxidoreductase [Cytophagaceae bacterium YF14B1]|uniref:SDR family oxidoreductase n=1 Tax=Xanthocytophaga flava TaxID=3048013 RepID=A0AAE3QR30_9BACT|nr:SDR family oxidoreductase [Xanthocytophaga flavus]MDJ1483336.1 SDR family oxidoreductase [Xanthocytophaga flavus]